MYHNTIDSYLFQGVVSRKTTEASFIHCQIITIRVVFLQKVNEHFGRSFLRMSLYKPHFWSNCHIPIFLMDVDSYKNLLSFEGNFVLLHTVRVLIVYVICLLALANIQSNYYRTNFYA